MDDEMRKGAGEFIREDQKRHIRSSFVPASSCRSLIFDFSQF